MKNKIASLTFLFILTLTLSPLAHAMRPYEKCDPIQQIPGALVEGTIGRTLVMGSEDNFDRVLIMKIRETGELKSLGMVYEETADKKPLWVNGNLTMNVDFMLGHYIVFRNDLKILTLACEYK